MTTIRYPDALATAVCAALATSPLAGATLATCAAPAGPDVSGLDVVRAWSSGAGGADWTEDVDIGGLSINHNPWSATTMEPGDRLDSILYVDPGRSVARLRTISGAPATRDWMPKGAPFLMVGVHSTYESSPNPFVTDGRTGIWTDTLERLEAATSGTLIAADPDARYIHALQTYLYFEPYTGLDHAGAPYLDVMIAFNRNGVDVCCAAAERVFSGERFTVFRADVGGYQGNFYTVQLQGPQRTALAIDLLPVIDALREIHNEHAGRADERYWMRSIGTWVEPFSGRLDYVIDGLAVRVDDRVFGALACGE